MRGRAPSTCRDEGSGRTVPLAARLASSLPACAEVAAAATGQMMVRTRRWAPRRGARHGEGERGERCRGSAWAKSRAHGGAECCGIEGAPYDKERRRQGRSEADGAGRDRKVCVRTGHSQGDRGLAIADGVAYVRWRARRAQPQPDVEWSLENMEPGANLAKT